MLVSLDIDGTLEFGDPPGPLTMAAVAELQTHGFVVGSASDRVRRNQQELWDLHGVTVDFVGHKHHLLQVRERFASKGYVHIGDTLADRYYARQAGFEFWFAWEVPASGIGLWLLGQFPRTSARSR